MVPTDSLLPLGLPTTHAGRSWREGRLEVWHGLNWGTVCKDWMHSLNAQVACRQLGYTTGYAYWQSPSSYLLKNATTSPEPIWLDNVDCWGDEKELHQCKRNAWGHHDCDHTRDTVMRCVNYLPGAERWAFSSSRLALPFPAPTSYMCCWPVDVR